MSDWTAGYVADIGYTYGYYGELNPLNMRLAFLNAGLAIPEIATACELGFGQGLSANIHAAGAQIRWYGTDFNPAQANFAQELARAANSGALLMDASFEEFSQLDELPGFDFIGLHGIWSWINDANRGVIVDFIRRKLNVGGVVYISYNTYPGWVTFAPVRHLLTQHAETIGAEGRGIVSRINDALEFADKLLGLDPLYARANPQIAERLKRIMGQNRQYLAHEYFNRDWHPMHFATMAECLEQAKLQYACSASYLDHIDAMNLSPEQQQLLQEITDPTFRESVRDFMVNQQFRRDYWVKGARRLNSWERSEQVSELKVVLLSSRDSIKLKVNGARGEASLNENVYVPLLDLLVDHKPRSLGQILENLKEHGIALNQIVQAAVALSGMGHLGMVSDEGAISKSRKQCERLNNHLLNKARGSGDISFLASPVTGGGVAVDRFQQLFLLAHQGGKRKVEEMAEFAWQTLSAQNQKLVKEGKTLETDEENLAELIERCRDFVAKNLPILKALLVV